MTSLRAVAVLVGAGLIGMPGLSAAQQGGAKPAAAHSSPATSGIQFHPPAGWVSQPPSSNMRFAQYLLPKVAGDAEDASAVVYYFGQGQGGGVQDNIDRWMNQMQQPDGSSPKSKAKTENLTVNGLKVTTLDVLGAYNASTMSGGAPSPQGVAVNSRMRAAVIETPKGAYFVKLVGPVKTVDKWNQSFIEFVKSVEFK